MQKTLSRTEDRARGQRQLHLNRSHIGASMREYQVEFSLEDFRPPHICMTDRDGLA